MDVCVSGVISRLGGSLEEHLRENVTYWAESEGGGGKQGAWGRNYVYTTILWEPHQWMSALVAWYSRLGGSLEEHLREMVTYCAESEGGGGAEGGGQGVCGRNYVYTIILWEHHQWTCALAAWYCRLGGSLEEHLREKVTFYNFIVN